MSSYGFIKLCYGVVGSYMDTSKMTIDEVVAEFLKHEDVSSAEEYYDKISQNTYEKLKREVLTKQAKRDKINRKSFGNKRKQIILPPKEYGMVYSELMTNLTDEEHNQRNVSKAIGDYIYKVEIHGRGDYVIIGKRKIKEPKGV